MSQCHQQNSGEREEGKEGGGGGGGRNGEKEGGMEGVKERGREVYTLGLYFYLLLQVSIYIVRAISSLTD